MSAHKSAIVRLGEAEYQRLREAEENLRLLELKGVQAYQDQHQVSIFNRMVSEDQVNDLQFIELVHQLPHEDFRSAVNEEEKVKWLKTQNQELQKQIFFTQQNSINLAEHINTELARQAEILEKKFKERDLELSEHDAEKSSDTRLWIENATLLLEFIQDQYDLDLSSANEFEVQRSEIDEAIRQFNAGRDDRAWSSARSAWNSLTRLRHHLEAKRVAVTACREELKVFTSSVVDRIQQSQVVQAMDGDGNELPEQIEVDFWTGGAYLCLVEQALQAQSAVNALQRADLNELSEWREEVSLLDERAVDLITQARLAVLASQLRLNVAQIVVRALETQGFFLEEASYEQNDFRGTFLAKTRSLSGSEVIVTIDPDPRLEGGGRMHIDSADAQPVSEHELLQRNLEIFAAIRHAGLEVGDPKTNFSSLNQSNSRKSYTTMKDKKLIS